jgi:hypothetical protein
LINLVASTKPLKPAPTIRTSDVSICAVIE